MSVRASRVRAKGPTLAAFAALKRGALAITRSGAVDADGGLHQRLAVEALLRRGLAALARDGKGRPRAVVLTGLGRALMPDPGAGNFPARANDGRAA